MTLPRAARADLLEFLGATSVSDRQVDSLILEVRRQQKRAAIEAAKAVADSSHA
jgi:hypothetical protein